MCMLHHIQTTRMEPWGFIKSSAQNKVVYMKLSLRMSFYLRRSLGGYMVVAPTLYIIKFCQARSPLGCIFKFIILRKRFSQINLVLRLHITHGKFYFLKNLCEA
jgi:hypothetical protein